jgi:hypothetical protein
MGNDDEVDGTSQEKKDQSPAKGQSPEKGQSPAKGQSPEKGQSSAKGHSPKKALTNPTSPTKAKSQSPLASTSGNRFIMLLDGSQQSEMAGGLVFENTLLDLNNEYLFHRNKAASAKRNYNIVK